MRSIGLLLIALAVSTAGATWAQEEGASTASRYRVGAGDLLKVEVFGVEELYRTVRVLEDGTVSLPMLGNFELAGLLLPQAEERVEALLSERNLVIDPEVSIFVEEYVSKPVYVQGAVAKPGVYQIVTERTLLDVLAEAGGLLGGSSGRAAPTLSVVRTVAGGSQRTLSIDINALFYGDDLSQNIMMQAGDIVIVPHEVQDRVYVEGAVENPGPVEFLRGEGMTVLQAISAAGGTLAQANAGKVSIVRTLGDGSQERIPVNLKKIRRGREPDFPLQRNDVVVVSEWFF